MSSYGLKINAWIEKYMFIIVPIIMVIGISYGSSLQHYIWLVPYLFAYVTITMAIGCSLQEIRAIVHNPMTMLLFLILIHVAAPLVVYGCAGWLLGFHSPYLIGLVMFTLIPVGISSVMWVSMSGGNLSLVLAIVVIDSLLSPLTMTWGLQLFFGTVIELDTLNMMKDLLLIVVVPTVIGIALNEWTKGKVASSVKPVAAPLSKLCFIIVILLNASAITPYIHTLKYDLIKIVPISILIVIASYVIGFYTFFKKGETMQVTMAYASGIRNVSLGIVIAMSYFSPQTAVPILIGVMLQQPFATIVSFLLQKINISNASQS